VVRVVGVLGVAKRLGQAARLLGRLGFSHLGSRDQLVLRVQYRQRALPSAHGPLGDELETLLQQLGYRATTLEADSLVWGNRAYDHPEGRKAVFVGDLVDRGPRIVDTVRLVRNMIFGGSALCVPGHPALKLIRKPRRQAAHVTHGLAEPRS